MAHVSFPHQPSIVTIIRMFNHRICFSENSCLDTGRLPRRPHRPRIRCLRPRSRSPSAAVRPAGPRSRCRRRSSRPSTPSGRTCCPSRQPGSRTSIWPGCCIAGGSFSLALGETFFRVQWQLRGVTKERISSLVARLA